MRPAEYVKATLATIGAAATSVATAFGPDSAAGKWAIVVGGVATTAVAVFWAKNADPAGAPR